MAKQDVELQFKLIDGVSRGLAEIQKGVSGLGASLVKINAAAELTGKAFGAISSVAGAFGDAVTGAASVEDALTRVNTITAATVEEQKALQDAVRGAVEGTRFSAEEAAGALVLLAEDGFSAKEAVDQLGSVLQFAQANAQSAAAAAGGLGAVLDTFGEKPAVIGELADTLTAVAIGAGTSTKALQEGLSGVGVSAEQAGLSLNDTIGYLGLLASRGIEGGAAVGNFNKIIREISDPASKAGEALATLGLQGAEFAVVLQRLGTDSAAAETVLSALGKKPREALRVLLSEGGGDLGKFRDIIKQATGSTKDASDALNNTFAGALARVTNQLAQVRDDLLTPILKPLAVEFQSFSAQLADFAKTEQFALIVEQFRLFATSAIQYVGDAVRSFDFTKAVEAVRAFAESTVDLFTSVEHSLATIAKAVDDTAKIISDTYQGLADFAGKVEALYADFTDGTTTALNVAGDGVRAFGEESDRTGFKIERLGKGLKATADGAGKLAKETDGAGKSAAKAGASLEEMAKAAADATFNSDSVITSASGMADALGGVPSPAGQTASALDSVSGSSSDAAQSLNALEAKLKTIRDALNNAPQGSPEFIRLAQDAAKLEEQIRLAKEAIDDAAGANDKLAGSSDNAAKSLRGQAEASRDAADAADDVSNSSSGASSATENFGKNAKAAEVSLGNYSQELIALGQQMQKQAFSAREIIAVWREIREVYDQSNRSVERAIDVLKKQNTELSEEERIRQEALKQYGSYTTRIEELIRLRIEQARATREANDESERELEIVQRRVQQAGGIGGGGSGQPPPAAPPTSAGRGSFGGGGRNSVSDAPSRGDTVINITGLTESGIRDLIPTLERELARSGALRR